MIASLARILDEAVAAGASPAAQACVISGGVEVHASAHGTISSGVTTSNTQFDIASVTKVVATTSLALVLLSRKVIELDDRAIRWLPELAGTHKAEIRIRHLLAHTSGLPAWLPLFAQEPEPGLSRSMNGGADHASSSADSLRVRRQRIVDAAASAPLEHFPGEECVYSDLGFILLGEVLARAAGAPLDRLCAQSVFAPLGLDATSYRPLDPAVSLAAPPPETPKHAAIAPTGSSRPRPPAPGQERYFPGWPHEVPARHASEPELPGEVDDDNAWAMGGVAGHAGLFSTAAEIARWGAAILDERRGASRLGSAEVLEQLLRPDRHHGPRRALGFDLPSAQHSSVGDRFGRAGPLGAAGHLGFTGCSIWIDFDRQLSVALLTNRVFPSRANVGGIRALRPAFHDAIIEELHG